MIVDASEASLSNLSHDLAIFGAGPAGITLACALAKKGMHVALFEAGGMLVSSDHSSYEGTTSLYSPSGELIRSDSTYMAASRLQGLGGTSNHWSNWCRPMDEIDFLPKSWMPHSGWPLRRSELDSYYREAAGICGVPPFEDTPSGSPHTFDRYNFGPSNHFISRPYHINPQPTRFAKKFAADLTGNPHLTVYLNAPVLSVHFNHSKEHIEYAEIASGSGRTRITAPLFVLACGGIENARLLLNWREQSPDALGTTYDLIGRYFSEDFHLTLGKVLLRDFHGGLREKYDTTKGRAQALVVHLSPDIQTKEELLNIQIDLDPLDEDSLSPTAKHLSGVRSSSSSLTPCALRFILAPAPHPESRILLRHDRDRLGLRKADVRVQFSEHDTRSISRVLELLSSELGLSWRGRLGRDFSPDKLFQSTFFEQSFRYYGYHHNGTTRMASHPSEGVTDAHGRLFDLSNLYLLGSSLFPISGHAPPTLTIVALALRMADHLGKQGALVQ